MLEMSLKMAAAMDLNLYSHKSFVDFKKIQYHSNVSYQSRRVSGAMRFRRDANHVACYAISVARYKIRVAQDSPKRKCLV